jgi:membrane protease subunit (stomatin/prohibitin family)
MAIIDVVKYDGPGNVLVWRYPPDDLSWGTQVIVNQAQEAIFYSGGQALDVLGPGTHTLKTSNIPLLRGLIKAPFGGQTPFAAEVYYINKAVNLDVKWGTKSPIPVLDPKYNVFLPIRAYGQMGIRVADSRKVVTQLSGTMNEFTMDTLSEYFRGMLLTRAKNYIADTIITRKINLLEISAHLEEMSDAIKAKVEGDFAAFGFALVNFFLESINVPDDDDTVIKLKKALAQKAELDIIGTDGYKTVRTFDTMEKAAANTGGGGGMGAGLGLGMGLGAGAGMGGLMSSVIGTATKGAAQVVQCPDCKAQVPATSKFCAECGGTVIAATAKCAGCQHEVPAGAKFCPGCGKAMAASLCPKCSASLAPNAHFCPSCGEKIG